MTTEFSVEKVVTKRVEVIVEKLVTPTASSTDSPARESGTD